jgi:hypothetical protein
LAAVPIAGGAVADLAGVASVVEAAEAVLVASAAVDLAAAELVEAGRSFQSCCSGPV